MSNLYTKDSIESLSPRDFTRLRPGVYCGSTEYSTQLLIEIIANAIDEYKAGHGNLIEVDVKENGECRVRDYGQGFIPNEYREDGETILQASFDVLNTSGKFSDNGVYEGTAIGLNGIGGKLTNFLSNWLTVITYRDGKGELIDFEEGIFKDRTILTQGSNKTGTIVEWKPSKEFFTNTEIEISKIKELFHVQTCICRGLTIKLNYKGENIAYHSDNGLSDLVDTKVENNELLKNRLKLSYESGKNAIDMVATYTSNYSLQMISYVNTGETDSGPHITQIKTIITREFNNFFKSKKWLKEKEENFSGDDIQEGLLVVFNITAPGVSYDAQTKSRIVKIDMTPFTTPIADAIKNWLAADEKEIKEIFDKVSSARKAREAAKKARDAERNKSDKKKKVLKFASKLADCNSSNRKECEIYITEGDSATGGLKMGRNEKFQAVMPVRGKILNCEKASIAQIQKNAEIMTMIEAFGLTIDMKTMKVTYEPEDLRYGKIIIMSDADVDGM